jgi:endonuclease VIII
MPEGPTLLLLREEAAQFAGRRVLEVGGNSRLPDLQRMKGKTVRAVRTWGKHFLLEFTGFSLKVHFMLFGSYRVDERRENSSPRLSLRFTNGELNFYACSVRFIEQPLDEVYDWSADVLSEAWDPKAAKAKLRKLPDLLACDALLDQSIFAGVGNIIKNEVLFRIRVSPLSTIGALPPRKLDALVRQAREYSFDFLAWRRIYMLTKNLLVHRRSTCPECGRKLKVQHLGRTHRRAFWCEHCQPLYGGLAVPPEPLYEPRRRKARKAPGRVQSELTAAGLK